MNKTRIISLFALIFVSATICQSAYAAVPGGEYLYLISMQGTTFLPITIYAGNVVNMAVNIKDNGTYYSISELNAALDIPQQFESIDLNDSINLIKPGATKTLVFSFRVKENTLPGYYPIVLTMKYTRDGGTIEDSQTPITETQTILVPVSKIERNLDVTVSPRVINPGKQTDINFTISNIGGTPVSNISFSWSEASSLVLPVGSDNKRYVSIIQNGQSEKVSYVVAADPNITTGIYPLTVTVVFADVNGMKTQTSQVGLIVGGATDFEVSAELSGSSLSISIANIGSNNAGAVVARIPKQQGISVSGSNTSILGNLNKGDYTLANFTVQSSLGADRNGGPPAPTAQNGQQTSAGGRFTGGQTSNTLLLEIDYTDTTGERQSVQKTIQLSSSASTNTSAIASTRQQSNQFGLLPWALLVLIAGSAIVLKKFRKKDVSWKKLAVALGIIIVLFLAAIFFLNSNLISTITVAIISIALLGWVFYREEIVSTAQKIVQSGKKQKR
ncbi:MAG: hypothetical protein NTZ73_00415 [Candidatus Diapherotrites archaeon]|nr:hypothetical protein [Candidatus Diapherotrites archaeon]